MQSAWNSKTPAAVLRVFL